MDNVKDNRFSVWLFQCYKDNQWMVVGKIPEVSYEERKKYYHC